MSHDLHVRDLTVRYGDVVAVDRVSMEVAAGTLTALVGPSGCGKTSVLRAIAGFETPVHGSVSVGNELLDGLPPEKRRVGLLFQQGALFPHLDVLDNVAFGLPRRDDPRAVEVLKLVGMLELARRMPHELSGGQQQRVALARAMAPQPRLILLDEPFAALDASLRVRLRDEVREILRRTSTTAVLVTHDQEEALSMADQLSVMRDGKILQTGSPREVYDSPASIEIAELIGDANLLPFVGASGTIVTPFGTLRTDAPDGPCVLRVPPESLITSDGVTRGVMLGSRFFGRDVVDEIAVGSLQVRVRLPRTAGEPGSEVLLRLQPGKYRVFASGGTFSAVCA